ncbi:hypothetical protein ACHAXS_013592 [Conticribra weissflogii]
MSSSSILYKFKASLNFETLPLPGTSARLFDIKRAIVKAKKLDKSSGGGGGLEFDLAIENATTNEVYDDENMILPRGTRIVVRRVASERGMGILSRLARMEVLGGGGGTTTAKMTTTTTRNPVQDGYYTFRNRDDDGDDDFYLDAAANDRDSHAAAVDEAKELEALKAVTDQAASLYGTSSSTSRGGARPVGAGGPAIAGAGPPRVAGIPHFPKPPPHHPHGGGGGGRGHYHRPNADPELREQEARFQQQQQQQQQLRKRATGIPRTFLSLNAPSDGAEADPNHATDGAGHASNPSNAIQPDDSAANANGDNALLLATRLQPNTQVFQSLLTRSGGRSLSATTPQERTLPYALKLTNSPLPEHLQCGLCHSVVQNAMLLPWDPEGRSCCETCIRDGLTKNGFCCPLTGVEGVSPDDLLKNVGLRRAAEVFVEEVMKQMDLIEKEVEEMKRDEDEKRERDSERKKKEKAELMAKNGERNKEGNLYEGDSGDRGVLVTRKMQSNGKNSLKKDATNTNSLDDPFGEDDEFGGDVFDVANDEDMDLNADSGTNRIGTDANDLDKRYDKKSNGSIVNDDTAPSTTAKLNTNKTEAKDVVSGRVMMMTQNPDKLIGGKGGDAIGGTPNEPSNTNDSSQQTKQSIISTDTSSDANVNANADNNSTAGSTTSSTAHRHNHNSNQNTNYTTNKNYRSNQPPKRRGPPAGYVLGPAGGGTAVPGSIMSAPPPPPPPPTAMGMPTPMGMGAGFVPGNVPPPPPPPPPPAMLSSAPARGAGAGGGGRFAHGNAAAPFQGGRGGGRHVNNYNNNNNNTANNNNNNSSSTGSNVMMHSDPHGYGGGFGRGGGRHGRSGGGGNFNPQHHQQQQLQQHQHHGHQWGGDNRKRPRGVMEGGAPGGGPMIQESNHHQGWNGGSSGGGQHAPFPGGRGGRFNGRGGGAFHQGGGGLGRGGRGGFRGGRGGRGFHGRGRF